MCLDIKEIEVGVFFSSWDICHMGMNPAYLDSALQVLPHLEMLDLETLVFSIDVDKLVVSLAAHCPMFRYTPNLGSPFTTSAI